MKRSTAVFLVVTVVPSTPVYFLPLGTSMDSQRHGEGGTKGCGRASGVDSRPWACAWCTDRTASGGLCGACGCSAAGPLVPSRCGFPLGPHPLTAAAVVLKPAGVALAAVGGVPRSELPVRTGEGGLEAVAGSTEGLPELLWTYAVQLGG